MFLISIERSATWRSIVQSQYRISLCGAAMVGCLTNSNLSAVIADEGDLGGLSSHYEYAYGNGNGCRVDVDLK